MKSSIRHLVFGMIGSLCMVAASSTVMAASCSYTPDEKGFKFYFTAFGAPDKSYVVSKNTFKKYQLASSTGKLEGATIDIDSTSLDTSADLNNGSGGQWDPSFAAVRNNNVVTGLFKSFASPGKISAKIDKIEGDTLQLAVTMNEVTKVIPMKVTEKGGNFHAKGTLDIIKDFNGSKAFAKLERICTQAFHRGKTWTDVDIEFEVPVKKSCK
ncbi:YceI family protein [Methylobacillus pratensis]